MRVVTVDDDRDFYDRLSKVPYLVVRIPVADELGKRIAAVSKELQRIDKRQIYHSLSYFHITVKELGWLGEDIHESDLPAIKDKLLEVASDSAPFSLTLSGLNVWPTVIYAEVTEGREEVRNLHLGMIRNPRGYVARNGYEGERMHPHATVVTFAARKANKLVQEVKRFEGANFGTMKVDKMSLVKTIPRPSFRETEKVKQFFEELASVKLGKS